MRGMPRVFALIVLACVTGVAGFSAGLARAEGAGKQRVAIVRFEFSGTVAEPVRETLTERLVEGLTAVAFDVIGGASVSDSRVAGSRARDCRDESCYPGVATAFGVSYLITANVAEHSKTYEITLEIVNGRTGGVVGTSRERCEICGIEEAGEKMSLAAAALKARLESLARAPARFVIRTRPAGAEVSINGKALGRTPLDTTLPAGQHQLRLALDGWSPLERGVTVVSGVDETMDLDLVRLPTRFPYRTAGYAALAAGVAMIAAGGWLLTMDGDEVACAAEQKDRNNHCPEVWNTSLGGAALAGLGVASATMGGVWLYMASPSGAGMGTERAGRSVILGARGNF